MSTFIYFEKSVISGYLLNLLPYLNPESNVVIQYASTGKENDKPGVVRHTVSDMRDIATRCGYFVREEDDKIFKDANVMRLTNFKQE